MQKSELALLEAFKNTRTQKQIAERLEISLSTVNNALKPLERMGALEKKKFGFKIIDKEKALLYFASSRNLQKDMIYKTRAEMPVKEIEKTMPSGTLFTAFTQYRLKFNETPADYSEVYAYASKEALKEVKKRFPEKKGPANLYIMEKPEGLKEVTEELLFADLWNLKEWYAKEFVNALRKKMRLEE